jgi:hypothetical protein
LVNVEISEEDFLQNLRFGKDFMIHCQNCGQINNYESNFCRHCGTRMITPSPQQQQQSMPPVPQQNQPQNGRQSFDFNPPRPYIWKTDEFQISDTNEKKTKPIYLSQPGPNLQLPHNQRPPAMMSLPQHQQPTFYQQSAPVMSYGYRCPRCGTQNFPHMVKKISAAGWIVFAVLLVTFFPLFWLGFLIKEDVKICSMCSIRVG